MDNTNWFADQARPSGVISRLRRYPDAIVAPIRLVTGEVSEPVVIPVDVKVTGSWCRTPHRVLEGRGTDDDSVGHRYEIEIPESARSTAHHHSMESSFEIHPRLVNDALSAFMKLPALTGQRLRDSVRDFVRRFGPIYGEEFRPEPFEQYRILRFPDPSGGGDPEVFRLYRSSRFVVQFADGTGWSGEYHAAIPVECYIREAESLRSTMKFYYDSLLEANTIASDKLELLATSLNHYFRNFVRIQIELFDVRFDNVRYNQENVAGVRPSLHTQTILGAIYAQLAQVITRQQGVRICRNCNTLFLVTKSDKLFCSGGCSSTNRSRMRRQRQRTQQ